MIGVMDLKNGAFGANLNNFAKSRHNSYPIIHYSNTPNAFLKQILIKGLNAPNLHAEILLLTFLKVCYNNLNIHSDKTISKSTDETEKKPEAKHRYRAGSHTNHHDNGLFHGSDHTYS